METSIISGEDIRFLVQQPEAELTTIMGQMTSLMQDITDLQNDTNERVESIAKQGWFKRMWATVSGGNKATVKEIQNNTNKVVSYISEATAQLYNMNCINQQIMCSLGNRINQVYMQITDVYNEQLNMKAQISEIMAVQQQTLQAMGAFAAKLNEKIESVDNFHMLVTEIQQGRYNDPNKLYSLCSILAQLDKRVMNDNRKLDILRNALTQSGIISGDSFSVKEHLQDIIAMPDSMVGVVYLELCNFRESFPANLFAEMIENYHFLSKMEKMSKNKNSLVDKLILKYDLDPDAEFSFEDISESFIENKQQSIVKLEIRDFSEKISNQNNAISERKNIPDKQNKSSVIDKALNSDEEYLHYFVRDDSDLDDDIKERISVYLDSLVLEKTNLRCLGLAIIMVIDRNITEIDVDRMQEIYFENGGSPIYLANHFAQGTQFCCQDYTISREYYQMAYDSDDFYCDEWDRYRIVAKHILGESIEDYLS